MRNQQNQGGHTNENLSRRTKVNWCLLSLKNCENIILGAINCYREGEKNIRPHRQNLIFSDRINKCNISKVIDRVDNEIGRCLYLIE